MPRSPRPGRIDRMLGGLAVLLAACTIGGVHARCGTVTVPESRLQPAAGQIALRVAVLPAKDRAGGRADPLFYAAGGPGDSAVDALPAVAQVFAIANLHRDIVFVDQRGTGGSNPLACAAALTATSVEQMVSACLGATRANVLDYRTPDAADDLEDVRVALGYGRIDLLGVSYGATAVQVYLRRHPQSVRSVVLDSGTLLDVPVFERWASNGQRALDLLHRRCHADIACRAAFPTWYERFPALLARLAARPVRVGTTTLDARQTAETVEEMTATMEGAARVPFTLAQAEAGSYGPLAGELGASAAAEQKLALMPIAIMCTEPWAVRDPSRVAADAQGTYLAYSVPGEASYLNEVCSAWPRPAGPEDWSRVVSDVPALVLAGGSDPKDPPGNTAGVRRSMPNAKVAVVPGGAHGVSDVGCVPWLVDRFLEAGTTSGLDVSCTRLTPYPPFRLR